MESLVGAFTSLAQLFESTYVATHSSFFAMVGVADQLGGLKTYLAQVLGLFSIMRWGRRLVAWIKGETSNPGGPGGGWAEEWNWRAVNGSGGSLDSSSGGPSRGTNKPAGKRPSSKPLILFLLSAVGLPWLMTKLIRLLTRLQEEKRLASLPPGAIDPRTGQPVPTGPISASGANGSASKQITFARALFPFEASAEHELGLKKDEIVAILQRYEGAEGGKELGWWRGRTRDGRMGWFPGNYVSFVFLLSSLCLWVQIGWLLTSPVAHP